MKITIDKKELLEIGDMICYELDDFSEICNLIIFNEDKKICLLNMDSMCIEHSFENLDSLQEYLKTINVKYEIFRNNKISITLTK